MGNRKWFFQTEAGEEEITNPQSYKSTIVVKTIKDYNGNWKNFIRYEFLRPALKNGVRYDEFWNLTPLSLSDIIYANSERIKQDLEIADVQNWQLGQYIIAAIGDVFSGKSSSLYPKQPLFAAKDISKREPEMTDAQIELETLKFENFFSNLGKNVAIKKKGGKNAK